MTQTFKGNQMTDGSVPRVKLTKNLEYIDGDLQNVPIGRMYIYVLMLMVTMLNYL